MDDYLRYEEIEEIFYERMYVDLLRARVIDLGLAARDTGLSKDYLEMKMIEKMERAESPFVIRYRKEYEEIYKEEWKKWKDLGCGGITILHSTEQFTKYRTLSYAIGYETGLAESILKRISDMQISLEMAAILLKMPKEEFLFKLKYIIDNHYSHLKEREKAISELDKDSDDMPQYIPYGNAMHKYSLSYETEAEELNISVENIKTWLESVS